MSQRLIESLQNKDLFDYPVQQFDIFETHISWVLLTGPYAYKIKKPVDFGFLDFSTLEKRRCYCEEEIRLNRRLAPQLYIGMIRITGSPEQPRLDGGGPVIEYAVKMHQFEQANQFDRMLTNNLLTMEHIDRVADKLAEFHNNTAVADNARHFGSPEAVQQPVAENFLQIRPLISDQHDIKRLEQLRKWSKYTHLSLAQVIQSRKDDGYVRECHGDMHLANIAMYKNDVVIFDCLEFNDNLRWIDVMSETAFLLMDLDEHDSNQLASRFLNHYLQYTGDYAGMKVLRYYLVYRAMVRAKVACLRLAQKDLRQDEKDQAYAQFHKYLLLAQQYIQPHHAALVITHGLSGSGKTTITQPILEKIGAIRIRSDVERKRLHGLSAAEKSGSGIDSGLYTTQTSEQTYQRLADLAGIIIQAGYSVIVDAAFLKHDQRDIFQTLAGNLDVPYIIIDFQAPEELLRKWITERAAEGQDASEADIKVLEHQMATQQSLSRDERSNTLSIDSGHSVDTDALVGKINDLMNRGRK